MDKEERIMKILDAEDFVADTEMERDCVRYRLKEKILEILK